MTDKDRYCPQCAAPLQVRHIHGAKRPVCPGCGRILYYDPKLAASVIVDKEGKVLMVRRATEPGLGLWSFPGGYVDRGEVLEEAAARELWEETGLKAVITGLIGVFSERGHPVVLAAYHGKILEGEALPGEEISEVGYFSPDALPPLAFPRDTVVLEKWRRGKGSRG